MTTVTIGGREFRVGAWYIGKTGMLTRQFMEMRIMGRIHRRNVVFWRCRNGNEQNAKASTWLCWAGDEVTS